MSAKNRDQHGRWRSVTIAFRVSPEENARINEAVKLSGITKQDFITSKLQNRDVIVAKSTRTYKALRDRMDQIIFELRRIESSGGCSEEFLDALKYITYIYTATKAD